MKRVYLLVVIFLACLGNTVSLETSTDAQLEDDNRSEYGKKCNCRCGESNEESRITGGVETPVNKYPWVARLSLFNKFYCGATLINDRFVTTAAHCVKGFMWFMIKVTLGEHDRCIKNKTRGWTVGLNRYTILRLTHNFTYTDFKNDVALLKMNDRIVFTYAVKPICLPHNDENTYEGVKAVAAGWGSISEQKNHSCKLLEVELPVLSNQQCRSTKYEPAMIGDDMMCAGYPDKGQKDTCQGDSGGPLSTERSDKRYELIGVVSWGIGCGRAGYPGVYSRVSKYLYWIRHNSRQGCFCSD